MRSRAADLVLCALLAGLTGPVYGSFFVGRGFLLPLAGAAVVATALVALAGARRVPPGWATVLWSGPAPVRGLGAVPRPPRRRGARAGRAGRRRDGLLDGWAQMLGVALPAKATAELVATPLALTWLAAGAAATVALRRRSAAGPLVPPTLAFGLALLLVAAGDRTALAPAAAFAAAAAALVAVRAQRNDAAVAPALAGASVPAGAPALGPRVEADGAAGRGRSGRRDRRHPGRGRRRGRHAGGCGRAGR